MACSLVGAWLAADVTVVQGRGGFPSPIGPQLASPPCPTSLPTLHADRVPARQPAPEERAGVLVHPKRIKGLGALPLKALDAWCPFRLPGFRPFPCRVSAGAASHSAQAPVLIFGIENIKGPAHPAQIPAHAAHCAVHLEPGD